MLFHPVYTPEELKAVEVSGVLSFLARIADGYSLIVIGQVPRCQNYSGQDRFRFRQIPEVR